MEAKKQTLPRLVFDALRERRERAFTERRDASELSVFSSDWMRGRILAVASALLDRGIERGDHVALISTNRLDWIATDLGILTMGAVSVPIFPTLADDQLACILRECVPKLIFVEAPEHALRIASLAAPGTRLVHFNGDGPDALRTFEAAGAASHAADPLRIERAWQAIAPDDPALLLYTSGTTGEPKGVLLSHNNVASNATYAWTYGLEGLGEVSGLVGLSVLPYAHILEHANMFGFISKRMEYHVTVPERLIVDLRDVRPHVMCVVPRLLERMLAGIRARASEAGGARAKLVPWALEVGRRHMRARMSGARPSMLSRVRFALAQRLVLRKIRPMLGLDRLRHCVSGSAPLHPDVAFTFAGFGIEICEGYGQTETSPVVCVNRAIDNRYGTVGKPIPGVEVRIAADGEILVRGPNVMLGYYRSEESPFTEDAWLKTGDVGIFDAEGYLHITDRKKELFKTSGGKYIAPMRVETAIARSPHINQVVLVGHGRPHPAALVSLNWSLVRKELGIGEDAADPTPRDRPDVRAFVRAQLYEYTKDLAPFEQVRNFAILPRDLTMENGEVSQTMKIKRRVVEDKFAALIDKAYGEG